MVEAQTGGPNGGLPTDLPIAFSKIAWHFFRQLPDQDLSRLITTAYTLAVYASQRGVTPTPRKTRFRWGASPCRIGFGPTGSTTKGFGFCLLHVPSSLPRLGLARGTFSGRCFQGEGRSSKGSKLKPGGQREALSGLLTGLPPSAYRLLNDRLTLFSAVV